MLCIVVMLNKTMRHLPFAVFSGVLAVSDSCILVIQGVFSVLSLNRNAIVFSDITCRFERLLMTFCNQFSSWIVVYLTIERMVAVLIPLKCREIVTRRRAVLILALTGCILFGVNVNSLWTIQYSSNLQICTWAEKFQKTIFREIYIWTDTAIFFLIPAILIIVLNAITICRLWQVRKQHLSSFNKQKSAIIILFGVSFAFVVLTSPVVVHDIYLLLNGRQHLEMGLRFYVPVSMWLMNYAVNFYLYSLAGSKVRNVLFHVCCKCENGGGRNVNGNQLTETQL